MCIPVIPRLPKNYFNISISCQFDFMNYQISPYITSTPENLKSQLLPLPPELTLGFFAPPRFRPVWSDGSLSIWAASELGT